MKVDDSIDYRSLVEETFRKKYGETPLLVRSPGRINIIGEHTDYNDGFVLPAASDKAIVFALSPRSDDVIHLDALNMEESYEGSLRVVEPVGTWQKFILGVLAQLQKRGHSLRGFHCVFGGNIPLGAGMSSSAALEVGIAYGLNELFQLHIEPKELALIAQKAEHEYAGVQCGIMDQYANIFGKENAALKIDCRTLTHTLYPLNHQLKIVLLNTGVAHALASSEYNKRRSECQKGVEILQKWYPAITHLRDVTREMLEAHRDSFDDVTYRRCKYVVEENERVEKACVAMERNDIETLGKLLYESHDGLKNEYEVSCKELDTLVEFARGCQGVYGARLMGGGFGGCTINLVHESYVEDFTQSAKKMYKKVFSRELPVYVTSASNGTHCE